MSSLQVCFCDLTAVVVRNRVSKQTNIDKRRKASVLN